jgi:hypothetical protein
MLEPKIVIKGQKILRVDPLVGDHVIHYRNLQSYK